MHNLETQPLVDVCPSPTAVADCAVCAEGFAPGIAYSCRQCSEGITRSAVALVVAAGLVGLLLTVLLLSYLGKATNDTAEENPETPHRVLGQQCWSCRRALGKMLPLTSIKIVVTVWQIISQVCGLTILWQSRYIRESRIYCGFRPLTSTRPMPRWECFRMV